MLNPSTLLRRALSKHHKPFCNSLIYLKYRKNNMVRRRRLIVF